VHRSVGAVLRETGGDRRWSQEHWKGRSRSDVLGVRRDMQGGETGVGGFCWSHNPCLLCLALQHNVAGFSVPSGGKSLHLQALNCLQSSLATFLQLQCPQGRRKEHKTLGNRQKFLPEESRWVYTEKKKRQNKPFSHIQELR